MEINNAFRNWAMKKRLIKWISINVIIVLLFLVYSYLVHWKDFMEQLMVCIAGSFYLWSGYLNPSHFKLTLSDIWRGAGSPKPKHVRDAAFLRMMAFVICLVFSLMKLGLLK